MSGACSVTIGKPFRVARICREWGIPWSTVYARRHSSARAAKRGPMTAYTDAELAAEIRHAIRQLPFHDEGTARCGPTCATEVSA